MPKNKTKNVKKARKSVTPRKKGIAKKKVNVAKPRKAVRKVRKVKKVKKVAKAKTLKAQKLKTQRPRIQKVQKIKRTTEESEPEILKERVIDPFAAPTVTLDMKEEKEEFKERIEAAEDFFTKEKKTVDDIKPLPQVPGPEKEVSDLPSQKSTKRFFSLSETFQRLSIVNLVQFLGWPFWKVGIDIYRPIKAAIVRIKTSPKQVIEEVPAKDFEEKLEDFEEEVEDIFAPMVKFLGLHLPLGWHKALAIFIALSLIIILPFGALAFYQSLLDSKDKVLEISKDALAHLQLGQKAITELDLEKANQEFDSAESKFLEAQQEVEKVNFLATALLKFVPQTKKPFYAGLNLLKAGENISLAGQNVIEGINSLFVSSKDEGVIDKLTLFDKSLAMALPQIAQAQSNIENTDLEGLSYLSQQAVDEVSQNLPIIETELSNVSALTQAVLKILGHEQWQRYLIVFQNNNELRATGGFFGSFALMDVDRGKIKNLEVPGGGTYDLQCCLKASIISPEPLHLINPIWEFQDSNWWPDFPTSARKMAWFYQKADGPSVDGVIALTNTVMEDLLKVIGPIEMPDYDRIIDHNNFTMETQKIVELEYDKEDNKPKQFLADLTPKILEKFSELNQEQILQLLDLLYKDLQEKQLMFYFNDPELEEIILTFGWGGEMQATDGDYLAVISTNIGGNKTDAVIKQKISHQAEVMPDGAIVDTVTITQTHQGQKGDLFTGVQNNNYLRVYVPEGSVLLTADGFKAPSPDLFEESPEGYHQDVHLALIETDHQSDPTTGTDVYNENDKTVFGNWLQIQPGEEITLTLKYQLPFKFNELLKQDQRFYSLLVQKQAGAKTSKFSSQLILNNSLAVAQTYPLDLTTEENKFIFQEDLNTDKFYGVVFAD